MSASSQLFAAVAADDRERVQDLLTGTPGLVAARDSDGATPLHQAALLGRREMARLLVEGGADVNARDDGFGATPAGWAIEHLRELGGLLAIEIDDTVLAIRQGE